jgi:predicted permease
MRFLPRFFRRSQIEDEMEAELRAHIQHRADDLERSGLNRAEAERRARIEFGGRERYREECRETFAGNFIEILMQDVRFGLRVLRKSPGFTFAAVVTLALAIGANAVVFGLLDGLILRPLNVPRPDSLYAIGNPNNNSLGHSYPDYLDLRDHTRSFDGLAGFKFGLAGLDTGDNAAPSWLFEVTGNYFDVLGVKPYLGRFFHGADEHGPNSAPYVVLSWAYWHSRFADDRGIVGRVVRLNKHPFTVLGVAPSGFHGTILFVFPDFYVPIVNAQQVDGTEAFNDRQSRWLFMVVGHLKPGVGPPQAVADLNSIGSWLAKAYPKEHGPTRYTLARPELYGDFFRGPIQAFLTGLMLLAGLILLAACANLGSLFAARAADRSREIAVRLALGSARSRILRQLLTEGLLISLAGGAVGLWLSSTLLNQLSVWQPMPRAPIQVPVSPDASIYGIALLLALASGFLFSMAPVRQVLRVDPYQVVKAGAGGATGRITLRDVLLVAQIAICAVLVTSSMVAVRGLIHSLHGNFGFEPRDATLVETDLAYGGYRGYSVPPMQKRLIDAVEKMPGVTSVALLDWLPLQGGFARSSLVFREDATDLRRSNAAAEPGIFSVSPGYFHTAETTLLEGRDFTWHDDAASPRVAVVNCTFARKVFGAAAGVVGRHYRMGDGTRVQVAGVVEDGKYTFLIEDPQAVIFFPLAQSPSSGTNLVVRSSRDPGQLAAALRNTVRDLDSGLPVLIEPWTESLDIALFPSRVATVALGILALMGAMLSVTGIFGMAAYSVSRRLKELGIRMAIGAQRTEVLQAALGRAVRLLVLGSVAGLLLGVLATRVLAHLVYQANPRDPLVLAGAVFAMALIGLVATWIPAQRALSLDPLTLLREE